jgi:hypothetical protein
VYGGDQKAVLNFRCWTSVNPTNAVGGPFILNLYRPNLRASQSHQRSWWFVHTQPTRNLRAPGLESHRRSRWFIHTQPTNPTCEFRNPTNGVGGSFILNLYKTQAYELRNPTNAVGGLFILNLQLARCRWRMNNPPTPSMGFQSRRVGSL